ncbi:SusC/RagA family TonB-linked outer membrane protein [Flavivirga sp. 57AJ16]|uniref:SusC/RagA family TonB-linked outer membrane protein n=1 Tax=Flavivirga sp. 57AJ16 TaxID=3025307 RepID=UPI002366ACD4|nr:SusC/RagA family TonB-linked outer membrane protein [Flavivirga sp. 57AJ16]MDD7885101.1 SusC/RagA family TonB-linked outer membrane protein [Flavivirga sp. 57AJ16]
MKIKLTNACFLSRRQLLMIMMKTFIFLCCLSVFSMTPTRILSQNVKIKIAADKVLTVDEVFDLIMNQTDYKFIYQEGIFKEFPHVAVNKGIITASRLLQKSIADKDLNVILTTNNTIIIKLKSLSNDQQIQVSGKVTDEKGLGIPGATVFIKGTARGTATNLDGYYTIDIPFAENVLVFSALGFTTEEVMVGNQNTIDITLKENIDELGEVTINAGYYTTSQKTATGSISKITAEEIEKQPVTDVLQTLRNRIPGLQVTPRSGTYGSAPDIQVRGRNSIAAGTMPLILLDGVPIQSSINTIGSQSLDGSAFSLLLNLNPSDIDEINVLKDSDATSLYGSRGANGVILITTKKSNVSGLQLSVNTYTGIQELPHRVEYLNAEQYQDMRYEALANDDLTPSTSNAADLLDWDTSNVTDWQELFLGKTNITKDLNVSLKGGSETTHFYLNAGYHDEGSISPGDRSLIRKSIRGNINHISLDRRFQLDLAMAYGISNVDLNQQNLVNSTDLAPYYPIYDNNGAPNWSAAGFRGFPLAYSMQPFNSDSKNYSGNLSMSYELFKNFTVALTSGFNSTTSDQILIQPTPSLDPNGFFNTGSAQYGNYDNNTWIMEPQLKYELNLGIHKLNFLVGSTFQNVFTESFSATGRDYPNDALLYNLGSAGSVSNLGGTTSEYNYASVFSRVSYNYANKYLVNANFRRDGSSKFGPGNRFGNFGSLAAAWVFSEETFFPTGKVFTFGKLRGSYGISGNDQIPDYGYLSSYSSISSGSLAYNGVALSPSGLSNPNFRWEESKKTELAIETGFLNNRVQLNVNYFKSKSDNQLISYSFSPQSGFTSFQANFPATVENTGFEITLNTTNVKTQNVRWTTNLTLSKSKNKIARFDGIENTFYASQYAVGESLSVRKAYVFEGLDNTGVPVYTDLDDSGSINGEDRVIIGDSDPLYGGIQNNITYKNWDLGFFIDYTRVNEFRNFIPASRIGRLNINTTTFFLDRWQQPGDELTTNIPKFTTSSRTYNARFFSQSSLWWVTENIFRLSNVSLAYNLPKRLMSDLHLESAKLYLNAQNVFVFDKYRDQRYDPLTGNGVVPPLRTIVLGINLNL